MSEETLSLNIPGTKAASAPKPKTMGRTADAREFLNRLPTERLTKIGDPSEDWAYVPEVAIPDGFVVQWIVETVFGQPVEPYKIQQFTMRGWVPYPISLYPALMPDGYAGEHVRRNGQILMIRRKELSEESRREETKAARDQLRARLQETGLAGFSNSSAPRLAPSIKQESFVMPPSENSAEKIS